MSLADEVAEMFAEYSWRTDDLQAALETRAAYVRALEAERSKDPARIAYVARYRSDPSNRARAVEVAVQWKAANRERARETNRRAHKSWKEKDPEAFRAYRKANKKRQRERNADHWREVNRKNAAAYRARKRAAKEAA